MYRKTHFLLSREKPEIFLQLLPALAAQTLFLNKLNSDCTEVKICFFSKRGISLFYGTPAVEGRLVPFC